MDPSTYTNYNSYVMHTIIVLSSVCLNQSSRCVFVQQTNNILAPIITHGIYSSVVLGHGLWKIHDHQRRLRQRVHKLKAEAKFSRKL